MDQSTIQTSAIAGYACTRIADNIFLVIRANAIFFYEVLDDNQRKTGHQE